MELDIYDFSFCFFIVPSKLAKHGLYNFPLNTAGFLISSCSDLPDINSPVWIDGVIISTRELTYTLEPEEQETMIADLLLSNMATD